MEYIFGFFGLIFGILIFVLLLKTLDFLFVSTKTLVFLFFISVIIGVLLSQLLGWILLIGIIVCILVYIFLPSSEQSDSSNNSINDDEKNNE